jgi:hypothetical protein
MPNYNAGWAASQPLDYCLSLLSSVLALGVVSATTKPQERVSSGC